MQNEDIRFKNKKFEFKKNFIQLIEQNKKLRIIHKISISITKNNTFINLSETKYKLASQQPDLNKKIKYIEKGPTRTLTYLSAGRCNFKGKQKASPMANMTLGEMAAIRFKKYNLRNIQISIKSGVKTRLIETFKGMVKHGLHINKIDHDIKSAHNGTRNKKMRRK